MKLPELSEVKEYMDTLPTWKGAFPLNQVKVIIALAHKVAENFYVNGVHDTAQESKKGGME